MFFRRLMLVVALAILATFIGNIAAQHDTAPINGAPEQQEKKTITLGKDSVEALLQVLSPVCRQEMASALSSTTDKKESGGDISIDCQVEIQAAIAELNTPYTEEPEQPMTNKHRYESDRQHQQQNSKRSAPKAAASDNESKIVFQIIAFVVIIFAAVGGYVYSVASKMPANTRKLSKKKVCLLLQYILKYDYKTRRTVRDFLF